MPEASVPSRFLEEVPSQLIENLGGNRTTAWSTPAYTPNYGAGRYHRSGDSGSAHFNYEDESQEIAHISASGSLPGHSSRPKVQGAAPPEGSINNIARFFGSKSIPSRSGRGPHGQAHVREVEVPRTWGPGKADRPSMDIPAPNGASSLHKGQRVLHAKYGEGTILLREGDGEDAKLTVHFARHGIKKLIEKFANLKKL